MYPNSQPARHRGSILFMKVILLFLVALVGWTLWPSHSSGDYVHYKLAKPNTTSLSAATNAPRVAQVGVRDVTWAELQQEIASNQGPIVIEFYRNGYPDDPNIADDCDKCSQQLSVYEKAAQHYAGKVTFLRFDVEQRPQMMQVGMVVFPTHVFMVHNDTDLWALRVRGFLTEKQFEELMEEQFKIKP